MMQRYSPILWILVIVLLFFNLTLLYLLNAVRLTTVAALAEVEQMLDNLAHEVIIYNVEVNQPVPLNADVPLKTSLKIPVNTVIPIDQVMTVPVMGGDEPIEVEIPVKTDFPVNIVVPVDFDETIRVDTTVQLNTVIPVKLDLAQTSLADYLQQTRSSLAQVRRYLLLSPQEPTTIETTISHPARNQPVQASPVLATVETGRIVTAVVVPAALDNSGVVPPSPTVPLPPGNASPQDADLGQCAHAYWPLRPGTVWTYNSPHTSYNEEVDTLEANHVDLATSYENQPVELSLECYAEGLGGNYLGDTRRLREFGELSLSNPRGLFLPRAEIIEEIGRSWTQENDVNGTIEAIQGQRWVKGTIDQGYVKATYTSTGYETLPTPLGYRQAVRIEQKIEFKLQAEFDLGDRIIPLTELIQLTNQYWFTKGIGLIKTHWQGGSAQQLIEFDGDLVSRETAVSPLAEEQLVRVCTLNQKAVKCIQLAGFSPTQLTPPSQAELNIPAIVLPGVSTSSDNTDVSSPPVPPGQGAGSAPNASSTETDSNRAAVLRYAQSITDLGEKVQETGQEFARIAVSYRNREITLAEFQNSFSSFSAKIQNLAEEIYSLSPPPEVEQIHQKFIDGMGKCNKAIDLMNKWFETQDSQTKQATALTVASCTEQMEQTAEELNTFVATHYP